MEPSGPVQACNGIALPLPSCILAQMDIKRGRRAEAHKIIIAKSDKERH